MTLHFRSSRIAPIVLGALAMLPLALAAQAPADAAPDATTAPPKADVKPATPEANPSAPEANPPAPDLRSFAWLTGCWQGSVNQREFRETWMPLRGGMMLGVSQMVMQGRTVDFEYLRLELRNDAVYYVLSPPGQAELAFRLAPPQIVQGDEVFSFDNANNTFPRRLTYHRGRDGLLYAEVEGVVSGADRKVVYPMRRVNCETGQIIRK